MQRKHLLVRTAVIKIEPFREISKAVFESNGKLATGR